MKNELLTIGPVTVYGYGLMIAIGILAAYTVMEVRTKKTSLPEQEVMGLVFFCALGGLLGAKLLFLITVLPDFVRDPLPYLRSFSDGFVVYGGILGGILSGYLFCRWRRLPFLRFFDLAMPAIALAQGFGRLGCFLAGCCYGRETTSFLALTFHHSDFAPNGVPLVPTQLYSSALDFLLFFLLVRLAKQEMAEGRIAALYLMLYGTGRFVMEFFRGDLERGSVGALSTSQFLSLFILAGGALLFAMAGRGKKSRATD